MSEEWDDQQVDMYDAAVSDYLEKEQNTETPATDLDAVPLEVLDAQVGAALKSAEERETIENIKSEHYPSASISSKDEEAIVHQLKAEFDDVAPELPRELLGRGTTLPPDPPSAYAKARARQQAEQQSAASSSQQPQPAQAAVVDPAREYQQRQQLQAYRAQQAQSAAQAVAQQNHEVWLQKAMQFHPAAYYKRAAELETEAEECYLAEEAKGLLRQAQLMRFSGEQVLLRHRQIGARMAFNDDAKQVILNNRDLFETSKGRGKAMFDLFNQFPGLANVPNGASIALRVVNYFMKQRREQG